MNCNDLDKALSLGSRLPLQAQDHVRSCNRCQELVEALDVSVADQPSLATLFQIAETIATNLRQARPVAPAHYFLRVFVGILACIVAFGVYRVGAFAIPVMTPLQTVAMMIALATSSGLLAYSLVHQMIPGSCHRFSPRLLPVIIMILLAIAITTLFQFQHERDFWGNASACIRVGIQIGALAAVPFCLVLRRGAVLSPSMTGTATGLLSGLVGTSVLEIHCPNLDAWHILVSHLGVAILCALAGLATGFTTEVNAVDSVFGTSQRET